MTTTQNNIREFAIKVRCGGQTFTETVYTYDSETAWGHQSRIENMYERDYGYKARITSVREIR